MAVVLESRDVHKNFGAVSAAADVNVSVEEGEVLGVIGANGAGKTTFVNLVTGYLKPDAGRILFRDRDITGRPPREISRLGVCRSFQIPQLFPELSAFDNAMVALAIADGGAWQPWRPALSPARAKAAERMLEQFDLARYRDQRVGTLAQGVRKLLDIAIATVAEPSLMLLDEPTSGISVDEKFQVMDTLMGALSQRGAAILFIEHDMEIVERYARRVVAFYDGRVIADGPTAEVLADPDVRLYVVGAEIHRHGPRQERDSC